MGRNEEVKIRIHLKVSIMNVVERTKSPTRSFQGIEKYRFGFAGAKWDVIAAPVVLPTLLLVLRIFGSCGGCSESNDS
jgi:hypothetical protein